MLGKRKRLYLDYAAATPITPDALKAMQHALRTLVGNPNSIHTEGVKAAAALEESRQTIARFLECKSRNLFFISNGTEGNNLALRGVIESRKKQGVPLWRMHIVVSAIEHPSVLEPVRLLEQEGVHVTYLSPDERGFFSERALSAALKPETVLVSIGWANSEIGTVQPISALAKAVKSYAATQGTLIYFHTDAGQAPLYESGVIAGLGVDLLTLDSAKMYGPRGIAILYAAPRVSLEPLYVGGGQESGLRAGTPTVALAVGMAQALMWVKERRESERVRLAAIRTKTIKDMKRAFPENIINGEGHTLPHILNVSIPNIDAEYVVLALDHQGIALSTKSSCQEKERESHVVHLLGGESWRARNTLRFSMGFDTSADDMERAVTRLEEVAKWA